MTERNWREGDIDGPLFWEDFGQFWQECRKSLQWLLAIVGLAAVTALVMIFSDAWPF